MADIPANWVFAVALVLYGILLALNLYLLIVPFIRKQDSVLSVPGFYQMFIVTFLIVRILWFILVVETSDTELATFCLSRLSFCLFFTALSLILFSWVQVLSSEFSLNRGFLPGLFVTFCFVNVFLYLFSIISVAAFVSTTDPLNHRSRFYLANIILLAVINVIAALVFLIFGIRLYRRIHINPQLKHAATRVVIVASVIVSCFVIRMVTFSWHPLTGGYYSDDIFYPLSYFVAEGVPITIQTVLYIRRTTSLGSVRGHQPSLVSNSELEHQDAHELAAYKRRKQKEQHTKGGLLTHLYPHENDGGAGDDDSDTYTPILSPVNKASASHSGARNVTELQHVSDATLEDIVHRSYSGLHRANRPSLLAGGGGLSRTKTTDFFGAPVAPGHERNSANIGKGSLTYWGSHEDEKDAQEEEHLENVTLLYAKTQSLPSVNAALAGHGMHALSVDVTEHHDDDHQSTVPYSPLSS